MLLSRFARIVAVCICLGLTLGFPATVLAQTNYYTTNGTEYAVVGSLPGDQVFPDAAITASGGFVVWQDNVTDGSGWGISARRLDSTLSGTLSTFQVNWQGTNDQENPRVAMLKNGGAAFVWQGGKRSYQHIYARFLTPTNTFLTTTDLVVSTFTNNFQINPALAVLNNSNVVVVWSSYNQVSSNSMQDVYGQILSPSGQKVGSAFLINQFTAYNQRTPAVAALTNGGFVVAWVSEQERLLAPNLGTNSLDFTANPTYYSLGSIVTPSVDIYARYYNATGSAQGNEFLVNADSNPCASPAVAVATDGSFVIAWSAHDSTNPTNGWDIYERPYSSAGIAGGVSLVNTHIYGDQYRPKISVIGSDYLIIWTSLGQDGSREGVYGQFVHEGGYLVGNEFRVNTTTIGQQMLPTVASDNSGQFLVVWTSFTGSPYSFDLYAQRYANVSAILSPISSVYVYAPFALLNNIYQPQLQVVWPTLLGISVSNYEIYVDGATVPLGIVTSNQWTMTANNGLITNSTHSFQVDYVTTDGRRSPLSPTASGTTWSGLSWGGIPYEWMAQFYGGYSNGKYYTVNWPAVGTPLASGGPTIYQIFVSGGNPLDSTSWLQTQLTKTSQGLFLSWNTQAGFTYQVQVTTNFTTWNNLGSSRFAAGNTDSIYVGGNSAGYYRVVLLRQ